MKLQGISINVVRNEYEYNKYVSEEYRRQYDYEASKSSLPWIIIDFAKYNALEDFVSNSELTFSPAADFTDEHASIDLSDTAKILKSIDEQCLQQGGGYLAELFYELIAQGKV